MKRHVSIFGMLLLAASVLSAAVPLESAETPAVQTPVVPSVTTAKSVSQYGITWTFDKEVPVGQFINGDWWVVGPVTVVSVDPKPGPAESDEEVSQSSRYGAAALRGDNRMRNGSMIVTGPDYSDGDKIGFSKQGYDSRVLNYSESRSVSFPCELASNRSLISTASSENVEDGKLKTTDLLGQLGFFMSGGAKQPLVLERGAVLTCLDSIPPADAFRPAFAGTEKKIYCASDIQWDLLLSLEAPASTPDWEKMARVFERPWLDHITSWTRQYTLPGLNGPHYGREFARMSGFASLMLMTDAPKELKEPVLIGYLQLGIDLSGLAKAGKNWASDGGHWQGRKWPILFAGLMLDAPELYEFPPVTQDHPVYAYYVTSSEAVPVPTTLFQEDMDFYYGKGGDGQKYLWQIVDHTGIRPPHQEKPKASLQGFEKTVESYYMNNVTGAAGSVLAAQLMGARALWNKEALFDHIEWRMTGAEWPDRPHWSRGQKCYDAFPEDMWAMHADKIPEQPKGKDNLKWEWKEGKTGHWVANPPVK